LQSRIILQSFVQRSLVLGISETVHEDEIRIPVNGRIAPDPAFKLPPSLFRKSLLHKIHHGDFANTVSRFGCVNIAVATGLAPNTGIPLPFVSYGLTSLVSLYGAMGIVLNIGLQSKKH